MISLVIYYDRDDDLILNYVKEFSSEIYVYSPEPRIVPDGKVFSGNLVEVLDLLKDKIDFVAFRERKNYPVDFLKTGDILKEIKKRNIRYLMVH